MLKLVYIAWSALVILDVHGNLAPPQDIKGSVCLLDDPPNQCGPYCLTKLQPMIENIPETKTRLDTIEGNQHRMQAKLLDLQSSMEVQRTGLQMELNSHFKAVQNKMEVLHTKLEGLLLAVEKNLDDQKTSLLHRPERQLQALHVKTISPKFQRIGSRYFYIENNIKLNQISAGIACREMGGHLASIKDEEEYRAITARTQKKTYYLLGINNLENENLFRSEASGKLATYLQWAPGYATNFNGCVYLWSDFMYLYSCYDTAYFICQSDNEI